MIDVHELLRTKENQIARVREEIKALHVVAPLLAEPHEIQISPSSRDFAGAAASSMEKDAAQENSPEDDLVPASEEISLGRPIPPKRNRLRGWLGLAAGE
jgi:hypothetical protein